MIFFFILSTKFEKKVRKKKREQRKLLQNMFLCVCTRWLLPRVKGHLFDKSYIVLVLITRKVVKSPVWFGVLSPQEKFPVYCRSGNWWTIQEYCIAAVCKIIVKLHKIASMWLKLIVKLYFVSHLHDDRSRVAYFWGCNQHLKRKHFDLRCYSKCCASN